MTVDRKKTFPSKIIGFLSIAVVSLLALSTVPAYGQSSAAAPTWYGTGGNAFNWDYSPQTSITPANVQNLQISWVYPEPTVAAGGINQNVLITPIIENGFCYFISASSVLTALNCASGAVVWQHAINPKFDKNALKYNGVLRNSTS